MATTTSSASAGAASSDVPEVTLSAAAARHVHRYAAKYDKECSIRIGVRTSSCSAHAYTFELDSNSVADDYVCESEGVRLIIDPKSLVYLAGTCIDYQKEGLQEGFRFENPNVKGTCGCGESFTV